MRSSQRDAIHRMLRFMVLLTVIVPLGTGGVWIASRIVDAWIALLQQLGPVSGTLAAIVIALTVSAGIQWMIDPSWFARHANSGTTSGRYGNQSLPHNVHLFAQSRQNRSTRRAHRRRKGVPAA